MKAIYAGSFSPPTLGHMDIITRAAGLFDEVIVAVLSQAAKTYQFLPEDRVEMLKTVTRDIPNVRVISDRGLLVDVMKREKADVIIRGLRSSEDLLFELQVAEANRQIGSAETLFLGCRPEYSMISSTVVRDCASHGAPIDSMVPKEIVDKIYDVYRPKSGTERKG